MSKACDISRAIVMVLWGRFLLVESCYYVVSELVKCCSRRMFRFEAVLVVDRRYVIGDVGEDDFFKEFGCWGQEGNGSIGGALVGIFAWFGNRYYFC